MGRLRFQPCSTTPNTAPRPARRVYRALAVLVFLLLAVGVYAVVTGGAAAHAAAPPDRSGPSAGDFGFALAAGAVALAATLMMSRPRFRFRR